MRTKIIAVWVLLASFGLSIIGIGLAKAVTTEPLELPTLTAEKNAACQIEDVSVKALPGKTRIIITSDRPAEYSCFVLTEPHRFVVDLANAILVWPKKVIKVDGGVVTRVRAGQYNLKPPRARIVMDLTEAAVCDVEAKGNQVLVDVVIPPSVQRITNVSLKELPGKSRVTITAEGPVKYTSFNLLDPPRVVVDVSNSIIDWPAKELIVSKGVVKKIRSGQFKEEIARVVVDLVQSATYRTSSVDNKVILDINEPVKPVERKVPPEREKAIIVSMDFKDADIGNVLRILGEKANLNIITDPTIKGKITVSLREVSAQDALELILDVNGLSYQKTDNILRVASQEKLAAMVPKVMDTIKLECLDAPKAKEILVGLNFKGENIQVDEERNKLIIIDIPENVRRMRESLTDIDQLPFQVMLEAKIVEVSVDALKELGFEWGGESPDVRKIVVTPVKAEDREVELEDVFRLNAFKWHGVAVSSALNILEDKGKARVLANPRLTTLNNEQATMLIGDRVPYTVTTVVEGVATTEIRYIEAGIRLKITPRVTEGGYIITRIRPEVSYIYSWVGDNPWIKTREAEAVVWLKDGEVAVLSGLLGEEEREKLSKVPILGHIPGLGLLFTKERKEKTKTEIIITVTPHILTQEEAAEITKKGQARMRKAEEIFKKKK